MGAALAHSPAHAHAGDAATTAAPRTARPILRRDPLPDQAGRCPCGGGCPACAGATLQTKLLVGAVDDPLEREADRIAEQIVSGGAATIDVVHVDYKVCPSALRSRGRLTLDTRPAISGPHSTPQYRSRPARGSDVDLPGECGTVTDVDLEPLAEHLGPGRAFPAFAVHAAPFMHREDVERIRVHDDARARRVATSVGAAALSWGRHIVLSTAVGALDDATGHSLLRHEMSHIFAERGETHQLNAWFSRRLNRGQQPGYSLAVPFGLGHSYVIRITDDSPNTHEALTVEALKGLSGSPFSKDAVTILLEWCAELDRWKTLKPRTLESLMRQAPPETMRALGKIVPPHAGMEGAVAKLHAYTREDVSAPGTLLREGARLFDSGAFTRGLELLGMSLHPLQDWYAHQAPIVESGFDLRKEAEKQGGAENRQVMEDDPRWIPDRWSSAVKQSRDHLAKFVKALSPARRRDLAHFTGESFPIPSEGTAK